MSEYNCAHPGCYETEETATMYDEPSRHDSSMSFTVCGQHCDFDKDGVSVIAGPAAEVSAVILVTLQEQRE